MTQALVKTAAIVMVVLILPGAGLAHFGAIIPSGDIVTAGGGKDIALSVMFIHPFEGHYMEMERPSVFGLALRGKTYDLLGTLRARKVRGFTTWQSAYTVKRPGDHVFYMEPAPYWEPAEETFIVHCTKVVVGAMDLEDGWDRPVGLKAEIVPLSRPYGLWAGNVFQGVVLMGGRPAPHAEVEVEYLNGKGAVRAPFEAYVSQRIKADSNGLFTYAMPRAGWWGFAALKEADYRLERDGKDYPVELGAVIWVYTRQMRGH